MRPVGARALKSALDTLRPHLPEALVLDLFAGSGRFGLGACREGAQAVLVEKDPRLCADIQGDIDKYAFPAHVIRSDVFRYLERAAPQRKFDVIFADPPFPDWSTSYELRLFEAVSRVMARTAILLVKYPTRVLASSALPGFKLWKSTRFGESELRYFKSSQPAG